MSAARELNDIDFSSVYMQTSICMLGLSLIHAFNWLSKDGWYRHSGH